MLPWTLSIYMAYIWAYVSSSDKDNDIPSLLYWIPKLHKNPYRQRLIAGSFTCSTNPLST